MSIRRYYRFTSPEALTASRQYAAECIELQNQAKALGNEFGGKPLFSTGLHGRGFAGLVFDPRLDSPHWTKPDKRNGNVQRLRSSVPAPLRAEHVAMKARWEAAEPTAKPSTDALFKAFGTDWGVLLFTGIGYVLTDTAVYVVTSLDLSKHGQEITGGEYQAAGESKAAAA